MMFGIGYQFDLAWIDHNEWHTFHDLLLQACAGDGVAFGRVGSDDQNALRVFEIFDGVRRGTCAKALLHAPGGGGMADAGAAVDVVRTHHGTYEFLHEVVFLIGAASGGDACDGIATVILFDASQIGKDVVISFSPSSFGKAAVGLFDERLAQAISMIVKLEGKAAFQASVGMVHLGIDRCLDAKYFIALGRHIQIAADAAVSADGACFLGGLDGL